MYAIRSYYGICLAEEGLVQLNPGKAVVQLVDLRLQGLSPPSQYRVHALYSHDAIVPRKLAELDIEAAQLPDLNQLKEATLVIVPIIVAGVTERAYQAHILVIP